MAKNPKQRKPTILHLISCLNTVGGTERQLGLLISHAPAFNHVIVCLQEWGAMAESLLAKGFSVHHIPTPHMFSPSSIRAFRTLLKQTQPNIIITYLPFADLYGRLWGNYFGVPILCSVRATMNTYRYILFHVIDRLTSCLVKHYIVNAPTTKQFLIYHKHIAAENISVVPNGVDGRQFTTPVNRRQMCRELSLADDRTIIICVAKLRTEQKGHRYLLEAIRRLVHSGNSISLILVGDGPDRTKVMKWISELDLEDHVSLLGDRADVAKLLNMADLFVLPTLYEGMSNALLEAMSAGCAIVTTDIPENRDVVYHEESALLVSPKNTDQLVTAIERLMTDDDLRTHIATQAQKKAGTFAIDVIAARFTEIIKPYLHL